MPGKTFKMRSQAQARAMHAAAEGHSNIGISQSVGEKLVKETAGQKVGGLPQHVERRATGGHIKPTKW